MKYLLLLCFVLFRAVMPAQDLSASMKVPAAIAPGSDAWIEVSITKGSLNGFMKYFQALPEGFTASEGDSFQGSFTFSDGAVKIVWIAPPADPTFTVKYKISAPPSASGSHSLSAKISYIVDNERKTFDIAPLPIVAGAAPPATAKPSSPAKANPPAGKSEAETTAGTTPPKPSTEPTAAAQKPAAVPAQKSPAPRSNPPSEKATVSAGNTTAPATAMAGASGKTYRVQIGAFASKPQIAGVPEVSTVVLENGITKYFSGNFSTYEAAAQRKKEMAEKGFPGAFIVAFENGKIVPR